MGKPVVLTDYHKQLITDVFGTKKTEDGLRRYRTVYQEIPKKNGKSIILSALGLYFTCADGEKGAEIYAVAGDKEQARIIFDTSRQMVEQNKDLDRIFQVYKNSIVHKKSGSSYKVISADAPTKHGFNIHALLFDELHVQRNGELYSTLSKGVASRKQPMVLMISTAGFKGTWAHGRHLAFKSIYEGRVKSKYTYVQMWGTPERDAYKEEVWNNEEVWKQVNPGYGITVNKEYFESQIEEVKLNPGELAAFLRLHLNVWTGTERAWEVTKYWSRGDEAVDEAALENKVCYMGVDLAAVGDTTAVCLIFPDEDEGFDVLCRVYIPEETLMQRKVDEHSDWDTWVRNGLVKITPGNITDENVICEDIQLLAQKYNIVNMGFDPWNAYKFIGTLQAMGLPADKYPQTLKGISPPMKMVEKLITAGKLRHGGHPVLAWQAGNVVVKEDANQNRMPNKASSKSRIDLIAALITAFGVYLTSQEVPQRSIYENTELWK